MGIHRGLGMNGTFMPLVDIEPRVEGFAAVAEAAMLRA
jgi:hypothetical protein